MARRRRQHAEEPEQEPLPTVPAVAFLDTLRRGDWETALDMLPADAQLSVPQFKLTAEGRDLRVFINDSLFFFPDLAYHPHTRRTGPGLVVDEGFISGTPAAKSTGHRPMNSSIKLAAHHDETEVRLLVLDLDPTPIMHSLGGNVDRAAALYSELQTLRAGMYDHLEEHSLLPPEADEESAEQEGHRRRGLGSFLRRK